MTDQIHDPSLRRGTLAGLAFFARRPGLLPEMVRRQIRHARFRLNLGGGMRRSGAGDDYQKAVEWCSARAVDTATGLAAVGVSPDLLVPVSDLFAAELSAAAARIAPFSAACDSSIADTRIRSFGGNLDLMYSLCEHLRARRVLETGVAFGWSSLAALLSLRNRPHARLYSIDFPDWRKRAERWVGAAVSGELRPQWRLVVGADRECIPRTIREAGQLDLVHYDSDKFYESRRWAYRELWRALRPGGILVSDDIGDNLAFRDFCAEIGREPVILDDPPKFEGILVKP